MGKLEMPLQLVEGYEINCDHDNFKLLFVKKFCCFLSKSKRKSSGNIASCEKNTCLSFIEALRPWVMKDAIQLKNPTCMSITLF